MLWEGTQVTIPHAQINSFSCPGYDAHALCRSHSMWLQPAESACSCRAHGWKTRPCVWVADHNALTHTYASHFCLACLLPYPLHPGQEDIYGFQIRELSRPWANSTSFIQPTCSGQAGAKLPHYLGIPNNLAKHLAKIAEQFVCVRQLWVLSAENHNNRLAR